MNMMTTIVLAIAAFMYILYMQFVKRPVTTRDFLLPVIGGCYLAYTYMNHAALVAVIVVLGGALFGIGTGLVGGLFVRVWRDNRDGQVYQRGGWTYLLIFLGLLVIRFLLHIAIDISGISASFSALNDAFIAMAVGNYLGRAINVGLRALSLVGWDYQLLSPQRSAGLSRSSHRDRW